MLPDHVSIILLSATVPNAVEFSEWIGYVVNYCLLSTPVNTKPNACMLGKTRLNHARLLEYMTY